MDDSVNCSFFFFHLFFFFWVLFFHFFRFADATAASVRSDRHAGPICTEDRTCPGQIARRKGDFTPRTEIAGDYARGNEYFWHRFFFFLISLYFVGCAVCARLGVIIH